MSIPQPVMRDQCGLLLQHVLTHQAWAVFMNANLQQKHVNPGIIMYLHEVQLIIIIVKN